MPEIKSAAIFLQVGTTCGLLTSSAPRSVCTRAHTVHSHPAAQTNKSCIGLTDRLCPRLKANTSPSREGRTLIYQVIYISDRAAREGLTNVIIWKRQTLGWCHNTTDVVLFSQLNWQSDFSGLSLIPLPRNGNQTPPTCCQTELNRL